MKWKTKYPPVLGSISKRVAFAWLPRELAGGTTVWLERYVRVEEWNTYFNGLHHGQKWWFKEARPFRASLSVDNL